VLKSSQRKHVFCYETIIQKARHSTDIFVRTKQQKWIGTWSVKSMYRAGSLTAAAARELARYKLDLVGIQEVRWKEGGTIRAGDYNFSMGLETKIISWEQDF